MSARDTIGLFGIAIDNVTMAQALEQLRLVLMDEGGHDYVVTPNVHHIVRLQRDALFRRAFERRLEEHVDLLPTSRIHRPQNPRCETRRAADGADSNTFRARLPWEKN